MNIFKKKITCPNGHENAEGSRFCSKCGLPLEGTTPSVCPSCGAAVSAGAAFCRKCGTKLSAALVYTRTADTSKELGSNRQWMRNPGDFAQRFDIADIKGIFSKRVTIEQGTKAILLQGGVYKGTLPAGVYNLGSILSTIGQLKLDERATIIIIDAGEIPLTFMIPKEALRTKDAVSVSASGKVTARIKDPSAFLENYLKRESHVSLRDIEQYISDELRNIAQNALSAYDAVELYGNAGLCEQVSRAFKTSLNAGFGTKGIEISSLTCIGFDEGAWREVLQARQNLTVATGRAQAEFEQKTVVRNYANADKIDEIEGNTAILRTRQEGRHAYEDSETDHRISQKEKVRRAEFNADMEEMNGLLDIRERKRAMHREDERRHIENLDSASIETLIFMADGSKAGALAKLELAKRGVSLTPEQILAIQAGDSAAAANALGRKYSAEEQKEFNQRTEALYRENADRNERILEKSLDAMGRTATARATAHNPGTTVVSGGMGAPVVVASGKTNTCPHCGAGIAPDDAFCPECGEHI